MTERGFFQDSEFARFPKTRVEFEGRIVPVIQQVPIIDFFTGLNNLKPGAEVVVSTNVPDFSVLIGGGPFPPRGILTDGTIKGARRTEIGVTKLDITSASYIFWVSIDDNRSAARADFYPRTSTGEHFTHHMMYSGTFNDLRQLAKKVPGNTLQLRSRIR